MADTPSEPIELLRARERAKRLLVVGVIGMLYAAGWLLFAWRASRIAETECTVVRVAGDVYCTVSHVIDDEAHTLPWENCVSPTRWPKGAAIGSKLHCYYYRNFPAGIFFEEREHRWLGPIPLTVLGAALGVFGLGLRRRLRARARAEAPTGVAHAYRARGTAVAEPRAPLEIPLARGGWASWVFGTPFLVLGTVLVFLTTLLGWQIDGDLGVAGLLFVVVSHGTALVGVFGLLYRSGLVFDADRGMFLRWWGLPQRFFFDYASLDALESVRVKQVRGSRTSNHYLVLHFADGTDREYLRTGDEQAAAETEQIKKYLWRETDPASAGINARER